jgi:predicted nucleotidyltransferase
MSSLLRKSDVGQVLDLRTGQAARFAFLQVSSPLAAETLAVRQIRGMSKENLVRSKLLTAVHEFLRSASRLSGVRRIALIGSLTTVKTNPKDADVLVTVAEEMDLTQLAKLGRRLKGSAQQINHGADIFIANPNGQYIGRTCHWKDCRPGVRVSCDARNCGLRPFLHDDLDTICLDSHLIAAPPMELWPQVIERSPAPPDVRETLLSPLRLNSNDRA